VLPPYSVATLIKLRRLVKDYFVGTITRMKKPRRGRPPIDDPSTEVVRLRVTPDEKARYVRAAGSATLTAWIKAALAAALSPAR